ncbi:hypothetical protein ACFLZW_00580 [Chloroflexota bacterium]
MFSAIQHHSDIAVIIRSAHERTEQLCAHILEQQVPNEHICVIHKRPFSAALRKSYEIGIEYNLQWTLCVDADVLLAPAAITAHIDYLKNIHSNSFGIQGFLLDKFYQAKKRRGLHLYRTKLLKQAIKFVDQAQHNLRPETYVKQAMAELGYEWIRVETIFGIHDYEQFYTDIFKKMATRAQKSKQDVDSLINRSLLVSDIDNDMLMALWGLKYGQTLKSSDITLDLDQWKEISQALLITHEIKEKDPIKIEETLHFVENKLSKDSLAYLPTKRNSVLFKIIRRLGLILESRGKQVQKWAINHDKGK